MEVSAVILSFNSQKYLKECLTSLFSSYKMLGLEGEAFVVDNGSCDQSLAILKDLKKVYGDNLKVIELASNTGTTYSRNLALKKCQGEHVLVLDSDAYMNSDCLNGLIQCLVSEDSVGMCVPKLTYPDGRPQISVDEFPTIIHKIKRFLFLKQMEKKKPDFENERTVDTAISACWLLKREVIDKVGLLDENIFYSPEDIDYCLRVWSEGYMIKYTPQNKMVHDAQELSRGFKINKFTFLHAKGLFYYFFKHK